MAHIPVDIDAAKWGRDKRGHEKGKMRKLQAIFKKLRNLRQLRIAMQSLSVLLCSTRLRKQLALGGSPTSTRFSKGSTPLRRGTSHLDVRHVRGDLRPMLQTCPCLRQGVQAKCPPLQKLRQKLAFWCPHCPDPFGPFGIKVPRGGRRGARIHGLDTGRTIRKAEREKERQCTRNAHRHT